MTVGTWRQGSQCEKCDYIFDKEVKWMDSFFVPVCPNCGQPNGGFSMIFRPVTIRPVYRYRWYGRQFDHWETNQETE